MRKRTNQSLFLIVCFSFYAIICYGQRRSIIFKAEAGLTLSVGKEVDKEVLSNVNPLTVNYIDNLHYRFPGFRVRIAAMKPLTPSIAVGLRGGANVHYFEFNPYGDKLTYFSFPIQAAAEIALLHFNSRALFLLFGAGHRFRKADYPPIHNSGGMLLSTELSFGKKDKKSGFY